MTGWGRTPTGSDDDIGIFDSNLKKTITVDELHAESDYSIWDGLQCEGYPIMTILHGKVIVSDGQLLGSSSDGRWLSRRVAPRPAAGYQPALIVDFVNELCTNVGKSSSTHAVSKVSGLL